MMDEFIPTYGNLISELEKIIKAIPPYMRNDYAELFKGTETQKLLFSTKDFEDEACEYCREVGWAEPS